jgi:hypothetical protein
MMLSGLVAGEVRADSFLSDFVPDAARPVPQISHRQLPGCGCADFSGDWLGACSVDGVKDAKQATLKVTQTSCQRMVINNDVLAIGGQKTSTFTLAAELCDFGDEPRKLSPRAMTGGGESGADWNKDKDTLLLTAHEGSRILSGAADWVTMNGTLKKDNAHLLLDIQGQTSANKPFTVSCSFEK